MEKVITIGAEHEFCSESNVDLHRILDRYGLWNELELTREFYVNMVEFNEMLFSTTSSIQKIEGVLEKIAEIIVEKAIQINEVITNARGRGCKIYLSSYPMYNYKGLVFNGLHLHINKDSVEIPVHKLRPLVAFFKKMLNDDARFYFSHHIWGAFRPSEYGFKSKARFSPCVLTTHNTIELRTFSFDDINDSAKREKLAFFIHLLVSVKSTKEIIKVMKWDSDSISTFWRDMTGISCEIPFAERTYSFPDERVILQEEEPEEDEYYGEYYPLYLRYKGLLTQINRGKLVRKKKEIEWRVD